MDARARSFIASARKGDVAAMERLVLEEEQQGRDPSRLLNAQDEDGWSALMKACRGARPESVRFLLQRGAEVRLLNHWGADALHWSCREGRSLEVVQLMMGQAGADPWLRTAQSGKNAFMAAAEHGHTDIVRLLLQQPQQGGGPGGVDQVDCQGRTALWLACRHRHAAVARLLVWRPEGGGRPADVCARDHSGCTPWQAYRRRQGSSSSSSNSPRHHDDDEEEDDEAMERFFREVSEEASRWDLLQRARWLADYQHQQQQQQQEAGGAAPSRHHAAAAAVPAWLEGRLLSREGAGEVPLLLPELQVLRGMAGDVFRELLDMGRTTHDPYQC